MANRHTRIVERAMTRLKLRQLRLLVAVGQHGSIQNAAHDLNISQPAATKMIQDLDKRVTAIPKSIGHHREWLEAIRNQGVTTCNFDYSGALAESVQLGNVAYRCGEKLEWDTQRGEVTNGAAAKAAPFIERRYRKGWQLL